MDFKQEFIIDEKMDKKAMQEIFEYRKQSNSSELGQYIGKTFEWEKLEWSETPRWKLEIAAFPIDKWQTFLKHLSDMLEPWQRKAVSQYLKELDKIKNEKTTP